MDWSAAALSCWAKLGRDGEDWMPLPRHLEDATHVAGLLWDAFVPVAVRRELASACELSDDETRAVYRFLAGVHDIGKASPRFAVQAPPHFNYIADRLRDQGFTLAPGPTQVRHEIVSQIALAEWLQHQGADAVAAQTWACVLGGHHGKNPDAFTVRQAMDRPADIGRGKWDEVRHELIGGIAALTGVDATAADWARRELPVTAQVIMTALVVMADWIASDEHRFPYDDDTPAEDRAERAIADLALPEPWHPATSDESVDGMLSTRFPRLQGHAARPLQTSLVQAALTSTRPPLLILEGPMGQGKTEAALLAAEVLAARFGQGGVFFGLPTMATANPMFTRTLDWLNHTLNEADASVSLAHGKAALNDDYADLVTRSRYSSAQPPHEQDPWAEQVYDEAPPSTPPSTKPSAPTTGQAAANAWLRGRRRAGLASVVVGTIDQALFAGLKAKHVALRHLSLAGKVVVIDEVHAADSYMRTYLERVLTWLAAYNTPVILMSATLPPDQREAFVRAYALGRDDWNPAATDRGDAYPRVTMYDDEVRHVPVTSTPTQQTVTVERIDDSLATLVSTLDDALREGGCAAVICNTVGRAQEAYTAFRDLWSDDVELLHSRFLAPERASRERRLVELLGPDHQHRPRRRIVVGTQVLEQSLDIDVDVMVTDLAPVDLVLQRVGRLHRHATTPRPAPLTAPRLLVRGVKDWEATPPEPIAGSRAIYGLAALLRGAAVLGDEIALPDDIAPLVRRAYDANLQSPDGWERRWAEAGSAERLRTSDQQHRASTYLLDEPREPENLNGFIDVDAGDPELNDARGQSQVRDSDDSLEVIAVWRDDDGTLRLPDCAPQHGGAILPTGLPWGRNEEGLARAMAACTLPLPRSMTHERVIDAVIEALERAVDGSAWQASHWVAGQLVLPFDSTNSARVAGFHLHYGRDGLVVRTEEQQ